MSSKPTSESVSINAASSVVEAAWQESRRSVFVQQQLGVFPDCLPDLSFENAQRRSEVGRTQLRQIDQIDPSSLPHDLGLSLRLARFRAQTWSREADWYWVAIDPVGIGLFGLFLPTAYCGGFLLNIVHGQFAAFQFREPGDRDRYLTLVGDYARLVDQFTARTIGQAERGIRMPKAQVSQVRALLTASRARARMTLQVSVSRLTNGSAGNLHQQIERRIETEVEPAFDRALEFLSDTYLAKAPDSVGIAQYPDGAAVYEELVKLHTTLNLSPEQVHRRGLERIESIESAKQAIRVEMGFEGDEVALMTQLNESARWRASTPEGVAAVFRRYIDRFKPHLSRYFSIVPQAPCDVAPLPDALQGSMTYGYYDAPRPSRPEGLYLFNAANLTKQAVLHVGALTYHELVPGHHLQIATQRENQALPAFRTYGLVTAYNEGWAEYAAAFAGELGLYQEPEARYGRLMMDALLTCRLVVDTGMNAFGWSLDRAGDYMRRHTGMSDREIHTESVRYSCDIPAQSLAYKLGDTEMLSMRERMRQALGVRFTLKDFHAAILGAGAMPIPDLEWHIDHEIRRLTEARV